MRNTTKKVRETTNKKTFIFPITWPKRGEGIKPVISVTSISNTGILITCILLSIASGFIDLTFFSGLSKSLFHVGTVPIPASVLYTIISLGLIAGKFWCAMRIGAINELQTRLRNEGYSWWKNINKIKIKWHAAHKFLITISIITALSLSVNSIGSGVRTIEQNIKNMTEDANELINLKKSYKTGISDKREATKDNISGAKDAQDVANSEVDRYFEILKSYQTQYLGLSDEEKKGSVGQSIIQKIVNEIPGATWKNAIYFSKADLLKAIRSTAVENIVLDSTGLYEEQIAFDSQQIEEFITALKYKNYKDPDGTELVFTDEEGKPFDAQVVISILQGSINKWQAPDAGDVGESSKIFTLIATYIKADTKAGGMGTAEWMLLILIAVVGIVQEFLIALFTPKTTIDRKMLYTYDAYFGQDFNIDLFLLKTYKDYLRKGIISQKDFEIRARKCVELMEDTIDDVILRYSKKAKTQASENDSEKPKKYYKKRIQEEKEFTQPAADLDVAKETLIQEEKVEEEPPKVEEVVEKETPVDNEKKQEGFSKKVDEAVAEIESILSSD